MSYWDHVKWTSVTSNPLVQICLFQVGDMVSMVSGPPTRQVAPLPVKPTPSIIQAAPTVYVAPPAHVGLKRNEVHAQRQARMVFWSVHEAHICFTLDSFRCTELVVSEALWSGCCRKNWQRGWPSSRLQWWLQVCSARRRARTAARWLDLVCRSLNPPKLRWISAKHYLDCEAT